jgi:D-threonate/D-erythronate kinase
VVDAMQRARAAGARVLVADAADDLDLDRTVAAGRAAGGRPLWVGSAGLAQALAVEISETGALPRSDRPLPPRDRPGPILVCIGSVHPATRAQEARLVSRSRARVLRLASDTWSATRGMLQTLSGESIAGLVLTGGDTATTVCAALGVEAIDLGGEVASGVPWGVVSGGRVDGSPIVLKSGAFGGESTLVDAVDFLSATMGRTLTQTHADGHTNAQ